MECEHSIVTSADCEDAELCRVDTVFRFLPGHAVIVGLDETETAAGKYPAGSSHRKLVNTYSPCCRNETVPEGLAIIGSKPNAAVAREDDVAVGCDDDPDGI